MRSLFEILGPVMVGPSSSHTAGAVRIGLIARAILNELPQKARIILYGSFAMTYKGHGTDRALAGGLLGMNTDDERIKEALRIAKESELEIEFEAVESFGSLHPNTVEIFLRGTSGASVYIQGSSIGGGNIIISKINQFEIEFTGRNPAMLIEHQDKPGVIGSVTSILGKKAINIGAMRVARTQKGANNLMVIETDQLVSKEIVEEIRGITQIVNALMVEPIGAVSSE